MGETLTTTEQPRIYVGCLAAYNNGYLHGAWIDAAREPWALWGDVESMLAASPIADAEEYAIHDYEGFGALRISEHASLDSVAEFAALIAEHGALGAALLDHYSSDLKEALAALSDCYLGAYASLADYVEETTEETAAVPVSLRHFIDWQAMARDAEINGDLFTIKTAWDLVHVFAGR